MAETATDLQKELNWFCKYCKLWKLKVNINKTKVMVFSKGKLSEYDFKFDNQIIEIVKDFTNLGVFFSRGGSFIKTIKRNVNKGTQAMFEILRKGRLHNLSVSCQYDLFHKIVTPILLYGCEIWGHVNTDLIERLHLKFCKLLSMIDNEYNIIQFHIFIRNRLIYKQSQYDDVGGIMPQSGSRNPRRAAVTPAQLARLSPPPRLAYSGERFLSGPGNGKEPKAQHSIFMGSHGLQNTDKSRIRIHGCTENHTNHGRSIH